MLDFGFATTAEICAELGRRLQAARLAQGLQQVEVAARAGISRATLSGLENTGQSTLATLVQVAQVLGLEAQLQPLFVQPVQSIAQMQAAQQTRQRAPRRGRSETP